MTEQAERSAAKDAARQSFREAFTVYLQPRVLIVLFLGFSAGLPLALSGATLLYWTAEAGVNLKIIGLFALVGTPYTIKFLWAPLVDALDVPILGKLLGRRRGWLILSQLFLITAIAFLAENEQAAGMASYVAAYRVGMLVSSAGALYAVSGFEAAGYTKHGAWSASYMVMAALVITVEAAFALAQHLLTPSGLRRERSETRAPA